MLPFSDNRIEINAILGTQLIVRDGGGKPQVSLRVPSRIEWDCIAWVGANQSELGSDGAVDQRRTELAGSRQGL
jgi:hypothetical protein